MNTRMILLGGICASLLTVPAFADPPLGTSSSDHRAKVPATVTASHVDTYSVNGSQTSPANAGSQRSLNPQPLPPKWGAAGTGTLQSKIPQVLPARVGVVDPGAAGSLNPQPLPPKVGTLHPGDESSLNPQPLPPKVGAAGDSAAQ